MNSSGQWLADHPTPENIRKGIAWNPANPQLWTRYGRYLLFAADGFQPQPAAEAYGRAAAMNPLEPENWDGLATAYQQMGESRKAETALRAGLVAMPHSPQAAWRLANFLILEGRPSEALPYLRTAAAADPNVRPAVFELGWKILAEPAAVLRKVVPDDPEARSAYFRYLLNRTRLSEAYAVWKLIREDRAAKTQALGYGYVDALVAAGMTVEASRVWAEMLADLGLSWVKPPGELLTNGDFEAELLNAGLDWRLVPGPGYSILPDNGEARQGSRSLRVVFDGTVNSDFRGVWQLVPIEPNHTYKLRGYIRTENITTTSGVRFNVSSYGAPPQDAFSLSTPDRVGSNAWTPEELEFRTGPGVRFIQVSLRRLASQKLDNLIGGKAWIDNLSLQSATQ